MAKKSTLGGFGSIPTLGTLNTVLDSVDFVKKAWSTFNLPSSFAPTMDVEELDKRIADLKAVEQWLNVNLSMLRGTIQGLEIQRGTLAAVKAFGKAVIPEGTPAAPTANMPAPAAEAPPPKAKPKARKPQRSALQAATSLPGTLMGAASQAVNPGAWWNLLQSQFNQVAQAAMTGSGLSDDKAPATPPPTDPKPQAAKRAAPKRKTAPSTKRPRRAT
jgi:hypothetical protein